MSNPVYDLAVAQGVNAMGSATPAPAPAPETMPQEPRKPTGRSLTNEIDRLVGGTLPASVRINNDGTPEHLNTGTFVSANTHNANVTEPPSLEEFGAQISAHQSRIDAIRGQLGEVNYSRTTGQPEGHRITGAAREQLERELQRRGEEIGFTVKRIEETSAARAAWNQQREAQAMTGSAEPDVDVASQAAARESAIQQLAGMPLNGKPVGRVEAARQYDEAALRARADRLVRGK